MKKLYYAFFAAALTASCSDDDTATQHKPLNPGPEVSFNLSLSDSKPSTRTIYGDEGEKTPNAFPIYWVNNDQVAMAAPGAAVETATYTIDVEKEDQNFATSMTKVGDAGIQWGTEFPQNFYSVYPYKYTDIDGTTIENKFTINGKEAVANLHIRQTQRQKFTYDETTKTWKGTPVGEQGMKYPDAIMYAQKQMNESADVALRYIPFTTAFNITLEGLEYIGIEEDPTNPIVIQEVIIEAPEGTKLVGDFTATFGQNATSAQEVGNITNASNIIQIPCMVDESKTNYLHPLVGQSINFNVFAIPNKNVNVTANWKLHVVTNYKTYTRKLTPASENSGQLIAGQVHKLKMPKFHIDSETITLKVDSWMKYIPRNVYITDISLPGAWYSRQAQYQGNSNGTVAKGDDTDTGWKIQELWDKGVRAYSVETRTSSTYQIWPPAYVPNAVVISGTGDNHLADHYTGGTNVSDVMGALCNALAGADGTREISSGYAVLMISYADGGKGGHRPQDYAYWLEGLYNSYNSLTPTQKARVYGSQGETLGPNTTIGDVQGKLIIQVNVASGLPGGDISIGEYNNKNLSLPALFTYVNRKRPTGTAPISEIHWKEWKEDYMRNAVDQIENPDDYTYVYGKLDEVLQSGTFYCNYSMAHRTQLNTGNAEDLPTYATRETTLSRILRNSSMALSLNRHNLWSIFAAGGTQAANSTDDTSASAALTFASTMNQWVLDQLNTRIADGNYGPFGLVFCNYIANTAGSVNGNDIIARILRMNQLFRLSRDENKPEWPDNDSGTSTPSAASYSSTLSKDANGWNAY